MLKPYFEVQNTTSCFSLHNLLLLRIPILQFGSIFICRFLPRNPPLRFGLVVVVDNGTYRIFRFTTTSWFRKYPYCCLGHFYLFVSLGRRRCVNLDSRFLRFIIAKPNDWSRWNSWGARKTGQRILSILMCFVYHCIVLKLILARRTQVICFLIFLQIWFETGEIW